MEDVGTNPKTRELCSASVSYKGFYKNVQGQKTLEKFWYVAGLAPCQQRGRNESHLCAGKESTSLIPVKKVSCLQPAAPPLS